MPIRNDLPRAKVGKTYPITYFSNYDKHFSAGNGKFTYKGWQFERIARNKVKVLLIPEEKHATNNT